MKHLLIALSVAGLLGASSLVAHAQGSGSDTKTPSKRCAAGMKYDTKAKKCVAATPKGSGSG